MRCTCACGCVRIHAYAYLYRLMRAYAWVCVNVRAYTCANRRVVTDIMAVTDVQAFKLLTLWKTCFCWFPKKPIFVFMRHYFSHISDQKMYRKKLVPQVYPSFYILAKTRPNYAYDFLALHICAYFKNPTRYSDKLFQNLKRGAVFLDQLFSVYFFVRNTEKIVPPPNKNSVFF